MKEQENYEVIIIGGSFAGLSAALTLGRVLRRVLIVDSGSPCNHQAPYSHNFITQDGQSPSVLFQIAKDQVLKYETVKIHSDLIVNATRTKQGFDVSTKTGKQFSSKKLLLATGVNDILPPIKGFSACWGISALHCAYCHGFEVRGKSIGVIGNVNFDFIKLISQLSNDITVFANGSQTFFSTPDKMLETMKIQIYHDEIAGFEHTNGRITQVTLANGNTKEVDAVFAKVPFVLPGTLHLQLGCTLTETGLIKTDESFRTTIPGLYAAGDNSSRRRSLSIASAAGTVAGMSLNTEIVEEII